MDLNSIKSIISYELASGKDMEAILAEIAATANEIEAEKAKESSNREVKNIITGGTAAMLATMASTGAPMSNRDFIYLILAWLEEQCGILSLTSEDYDYTGLVDESEKALSDIVKEVNGLMAAAPALAALFECPKDTDKAETDPLKKFFAEFGLA